MTSVTVNSTVRAALDAAERGWRVFPLVPGTKRPAFKVWEAHATTDPERIRRYWTAHPTYGVGIACGPSGLLVIDLDRTKPGKDAPPPQWRQPGVTDGLDVLATLCEDAGEELPPATYTMATPSGGRHLYYTQLVGVQLRNTHGGRGGLGWLIDTRGHGGYVAAPGTTTGGRAYAVVEDAPVVDLPRWLVDRLAAPPATASSSPIRLSTGHLSRYAQGAVRAETGHVQAAGEGGRNHALFVAARNLGQLVAGGLLDEATARDALVSAAAGHIAAGAYDRRQAERTITSGLNAGAKHPRQVAA